MRDCRGLDSIEQGYSIRGPTVCVTRPAAKSVNCICSMKIMQHFGLLRILSAVNFTPTVHQPLHCNGCDPFGRKGWTHLAYSYLHTNYKP